MGAKFCRVCGTPLTYGINRHNNTTNTSQRNPVQYANYSCQYIAESDRLNLFPTIREELLSMGFNGDFYIYEVFFDKIMERKGVVMDAYRRLYCTLGPVPFLLPKDL